MNERIKDLLDQATEVYDQWHRGESVCMVDHKMFAELIIRECIQQCESVAELATITNTGEIARKTKATADSCAKMISQRFGIEL